MLRSSLHLRLETTGPDTWVRGPVREKSKTKKAVARRAESPAHVDITVSGRCMRCWIACCSATDSLMAIFPEKVTSDSELRLLLFPTLVVPTLPATAWRRRDVLVSYALSSQNSH